MAHLDSSALAAYNSLTDPHLQSYFSNERIRSHLKHAGLISRRGEIVPDTEYRARLVRRDHKRHVRQMLAENIVHRAIDMERTRQAELKRQLDMVSKAALVHSIKESRRRGGYPVGNVSNSNDMGLLSMHSSWSQSRPKSASQHRDIEMLSNGQDDEPRISRVHSAHVGGDHRVKYSSKSPIRNRRRYLNAPKSASVAPRMSALQRSRTLSKPSDVSSANPPCRITMVYYGPNTKLDYDHAVFEPVDEVIVMQQHCGGENLPIFKDKLKPGDEFSFNSRRHSEFPLGLSLYINGLIDSRISTCCEYKHRHGVKLGGERGHFAIVSVEGSKPCIKCRFEKQTRLKNFADSPKGQHENDDGEQKPITISIPISKATKTKQTPVKIPVRHTTDSNENNYAEDFDGSDDAGKSKHDYSSDSNSAKKKTTPKPTETHPESGRSKTSTEPSSTSTITGKEKPAKKTWQIAFHTSKNFNSSLTIPRRQSINATLKFSFLSENGKDETEQYDIKLKDFPQNFKSGRQDSFRTKLRNIGKPKQIRLVLEVTGLDDDDDDDDIKWLLDNIELIDPETQSHYRFPCNQWIRPSDEKILNISESSQAQISRRASSSTNNSKSSTSSSNNKKSSSRSSINEPKPKGSSRSSISSHPSYEIPTRYEQVQKSTTIQTRRISTDNESLDDKNKVHYRITIYPSDDNDGEFTASNDSKIYLRLNDQTKNSYVFIKGTKKCPSFESGDNQTFQMDLTQNPNEKPSKLTIGYYNSDIASGKWKLNKITLINTKTDEKTEFLCKEPLTRNDYDLRAEQTFHAQQQQSEDEDEDQSTPRVLPIPKTASPESESEDEIPPVPIKSQVLANNQKRSSSDSLPQATIQTKSPEKPSSVRSSESSNADPDDDDEDNEYNRMFKIKASNNQPELDGSSSRPKTRRGLQNQIPETSNQENTNNKLQPDTDIWRPSSELDTNEPVDRLVGLEDLNDQTSRSSDQKNQSPPQLPAANKPTTQLFRTGTSRTTDSEDDDSY